MKCSLCGFEFKEEEARAACAGCPLAGPCHMVRCPNCGYDMPREPKLITALKGWRRRDDGTGRKS